MYSTTARRDRKSAFTLIELLVVIAIIAILAAILFPVFAQARQAARGAASLSNNKQLSLAILMYVQDYDETFPEFTIWGDPSLSPFTFGGIPFDIWTFGILPYVKSYQVFSDPMCPFPANPVGYNPPSIWAELFTEYGYNYTALSPSTGAPAGSTTGYWVGTPATLASIARSSDLVMLAARFAVQEGTPTLETCWYGGGTMTTIGGAEAPDCSDIVPYCWTDWVPNGNYSGCPALNNLTIGQYTGGIALRKEGNGNFSFTDGHCKFMPPGQAAVGTNWYQGILAGNVHITNPSLYKWETSP